MNNNPAPDRATLRIERDAGGVRYIVTIECDRRPKIVKDHGGNMASAIFQFKDWARAITRARKME